MATAKDIAVADIGLDKELYPRFNDHRFLVDRYLTALDNLPPIVVTKKKLIDGKHLLIDGWHRLQAHRQANRETIKAELVNIEDRDEIVLMALELNATAGQQLSQQEKKHWIKQLHSEGFPVTRISEVLSVSEQWVRRVTEPERREERQARDEKVRQLADEGYTQTEIAEKLEHEEGIGISQQTVSRILTQDESDFETSSDGLRWPKMDPFNIWYFHNPSQDYDVAKQHRWGQVDPQILEHMLYFFTEEDDLIVDPMAGTGILGDVCDKYNRKYLGYDIEVFNARIQQNDVLNGLPEEVRGCDHMFLDAPYFNILQDGAFDNDPETFYRFITHLCEVADEYVKVDGLIFFVMSDKHKGGFEPMAERCFGILDKYFEPVSSISIPLPPQNSPHMGPRIVRARENRELIGRDRMLYVFRKVNL